MAAVSLVQPRMASSRLIMLRVLTQWVRRHVGELASMIWPTWAPESPSPMATVGLTIISSMASIDWLSPGCQSCTLPLCRRLSSIDAATSPCCVRSAWAASDLSRPRAIRGDHRETQPKCRHNARSRNPAGLRLRPTRQYDRRGRPGAALVAARADRPAVACADERAVSVRRDGRPQGSPLYHFLRVRDVAAFFGDVHRRGEPRVARVHRTSCESRFDVSAASNSSSTGSS